MDKDIKAINEKVKKASEFADDLVSAIGRTVVGQKDLVDRLLIGLLADGHILIEGVPGLAKTLAVRSLAAAVKTGFRRIQFTPDLLPADLIGTMIYSPKTGEFSVKKGPVFSNIILADEINRAPAKIQSALLEAMQERQVTIGDATYPLEDPFLVLATQNPIEQEGTYPLPEAQVDRFMMKLKVGYPSRDEEKEIMDRYAKGVEPEIEAVVTPKTILAARQTVRDIYMDAKITQYIVDVVFATRDPSAAGLKDLRALIAYGASPRASLCLAAAARANAFLRHRGYVTPEDVRVVGPDVLRHRVLLTYEAEAENVTSDEVVRKVFDSVEVP
jgi:MoxR-like ATPase